MTDAELLQWHEKANQDTNDLLGSVGETWLLANSILNDPVRGVCPLELRNALVRVRQAMSEATRRAMAPPKPTQGERA